VKIEPKTKSGISHQMLKEPLGELIYSVTKSLLQQGSRRSCYLMELDMWNGDILIRV
jgi:hypothetical protein